MWESTGGNGGGQEQAFVEMKPDFECKRLLGSLFEHAYFML